MPLDSTSYQSKTDVNAQKETLAPVKGSKNQKKSEPQQEFRALPKLNLVRVFAFVQQRVFLQEPISTCFSFLLNWEGLEQAQPTTEEDSGSDDSVNNFASEMAQAPSLNQGCEVIPCDAMFRNLTRQLHQKNLICLCEVDTDFFGLIDCISLDSPEDPETKICHLRLQVFQKHDKIPWQTDISTMLFTLIEQRSIKNSLFSIQKYMEILPKFNESFAASQREAWANQLASALIQIRVQGKQSECRKKVLTALDIAQVLYDQQFVAYLKKTFLDDNSQNTANGGNGTITPSGPSQSGERLPGSGNGENKEFNSPKESQAEKNTNIRDQREDRGQRNQRDQRDQRDQGDRREQREPRGAEREQSFNKNSTFTPRQHQFGQGIQRSYSTQGPNSGSTPIGNSAQPNSGKSSLHKGNSFSHQGSSANHLGGNTKRPFFQRDQHGEGRSNHDRSQGQNNDASSSFSHNTSVSQVGGPPLTVKTQERSQNMQQHGSFPNQSQPETPMSGTLRKRKSYDGRQKGLEGVTGGGSQQPHHIQKRFNK